MVAVAEFSRSGETNPLGALDAYELRHLAEHLEGVGRIAELFALLTMEWDTGSRKANALYEAKEDLRELVGYRLDVLRGLRLATSAVLDSDSGDAAFGAMVQQALTLVSVDNIARNFPPLLLAKLVACGRWSTTRASAFARSIPVPVERVAAMTALLPLMPATEFMGYLHHLLISIPECPDREAARAFEGLLGVTERGALNAVAEAIVKWASAPTESPYAWHQRHIVLVRAAPRLGPALAAVAVDLHASRGERVPLLLLNALPEPENRQYARTRIDAACALIKGQLLFEACLALIELQSILPNPEVEAIAQRAWELLLKEPDLQLFELMAPSLIPLLDSSSRANGGERLIDLIVGPETRSDTLDELIDVAGDFSPETRTRLFRKLLATEGRPGRFKAIAGLAEHLTTSEVQEAFDRLLDAIPGAKSPEFWLADAVVRIARHLSHTQRSQALELVEVNWDDFARARTVVVLSLGTSGETRRRWMSRALEHVRLIADPRKRKDLIDLLAPELDESELELASKVVQPVADDLSVILDSVSLLLPTLSLAAQQSAIRLWASIARNPNGYELYRVVTDTAPSASPEVWRELIALARAIVEPTTRFQALTHLADSTHGGVDGASLQRELVAAQERAAGAWNVLFEVDRVARRGARAASTELQRALTALAQERNLGTRSWQLARLMPIMSADECDREALQLLTSPRQREDGWVELRPLLGFLSTPLLRDILIAAQRYSLRAPERLEHFRRYGLKVLSLENIDTEDDRVHIHLLAAVHLAKRNHTTVALEAIEDLRDPGVRALATAAVVAYLPRADALDFADRIIAMPEANFDRIPVLIHGDPTDDRSGRTTMGGAPARDYVLSVLARGAAAAGLALDVLPWARELRTADWRAEALLGVSANLVEPAVRESVLLDAHGAIRAVEIVSRRCRLSFRLGEAACRASSAAQRRILVSIVTGVLSRPRSEAIAELWAVSNLFASAGGHSATDALVHAARNVFAWWGIGGTGVANSAG